MNARITRDRPPTSAEAWVHVLEAESGIRGQLIKRLKHVPGFATEDDIVQEARIALHARLQQWHPSRSSWDSFLRSAIWQSVGSAIQTSRPAKERRPALRSWAIRTAWHRFIAEHGRSPTPEELRAAAEPLVPGYVPLPDGLSLEIVTHWLQSGDHTDTVCIDLPGASLANVLGQSSNVDADIDKRRQVYRMHKAAESLSDDARRVFYRTINDESGADLAEHYGITRQAVSVREHKARQKVRKILGIA